MTDIISIDLETRSSADLKTAGPRNYFSDPDAGILCMAFAINDDEPQLWLPGQPIPEVFLSKNKKIYRAWNAFEFERLAWDFIMTPVHGFPKLEVEDWQCTAYMSRCNNMPSGLDNAARCLNLQQRKDKEGPALIRALCMPQKDGTFNKDPELHSKLQKYCLQDVRTERAVSMMLRKPSDDEWDDYHTACRMNDLGIQIDLAMCAAAQSYAGEEEQDLLEKVAELTGGQVTKIRGEKFKTWILDHLTDDQKELITQIKDGEPKYSLDKHNRQKLLSADLDPLVAEVLSCSDMAQKSSVGKFRAMESRAQADGRLRGAMLINGAAQTGRFSSLGAQLQNFPRDTMKDKTDAVRQDFLDNIHPDDIVEDFGKPIMTLLSSMLRAAVIPAPGNIFLDSDYSSIEGRVAPWLCDSELGEEKLDQYRNNIDPYRVAAAAIFDTTYDDIKPEGDDRRQVGKVAELSLQFGGGAGAFGNMARNYGVSLDAETVKVTVMKWRQANQWATQIWPALEKAFVDAYRQPGEVFDVGRVRYFSVENVLAGGTTVFCQLPDGRVLTYPQVGIEYFEGDQGNGREITYLRSNFTPKVGEKKWPRSKIWGGQLLENITQATAASLMRWCLRELDDQYAPIVATIHDQVLVEVPRETVDYWLPIVHTAMNTSPAWAPGLPVKADVKICERFGK